MSSEGVSVTGFSLKRGTAALHRGVKPANKVGAVNYVKCTVYMIVLRYTLATCLQ